MAKKDNCNKCNEKNGIAKEKKTFAKKRQPLTSSADIKIREHFLKPMYGVLPYTDVKHRL